MKIYETVCAEILATLLYSKQMTKNVFITNETSFLSESVLVAEIDQQTIWKSSCYLFASLKRQQDFFFQIILQKSSF